MTHFSVGCSPYLPIFYGVTRTVGVEFSRMEEMLVAMIARSIVKINFVLSAPTFGTQ